MAELRASYTPAVDIQETPDALWIQADLPGVSPQSLELSIENQVLWIVGRADRDVPAGYRPIHDDAPSGDFVRSFILGSAVDAKGIRTSFSDGILTLRIPKLPPSSTAKSRP